MSEILTLKVILIINNKKKQKKLIRTKKIIIPEIHISSTKLFHSQLPIKKCIELIHESILSAIPFKDLKYYSFYLLGHSQPLDREKSFNHYGISNLVLFFSINSLA